MHELTISILSGFLLILNCFKNDQEKETTFVKVLFKVLNYILLVN